MLTLALKFNENHDPANGRFTYASGASQTHNVFEGIDDPRKFRDWVGANQIAMSGADRWQLTEAYAGDAYQETNAFLRNPDFDYLSTRERWQARVDTVERVMAKYGMDLPAGAVVYRGIRPGGPFAEALARLRPGETVRDLAFLSTTPDVLVAGENFGGGYQQINASNTPNRVVMQIRTKGKQRALAIPGHEMEVLFARGRKLKFLRMRTVKPEGSDFPYDTYVFEME